MLVAAIIIGIILVVFIALYNSLVKMKNIIDNAWAQIDTQLQRRYDLIPNLVETVKGYATHEKEVFEKVTEARSATANAQSMDEKAQADNMMSDTLKSLFAVSENYPDLKASENFAQLQLELTNTENKIAFSRQFYNDSVVRYNTAIVLFPKNIIAGMFHFEKAEYFKTQNDEAREAVKVNF